jgi:hypothetical protein
LDNHEPAVQVSMKTFSKSISVWPYLMGSIATYIPQVSSVRSRGCPTLTDDNMYNWLRGLILKLSVHSARFAKFCSRLANGGQPLARKIGTIRIASE